MPLQPVLSVSQLQAQFVQAWAAALNPAFAVNPANIPPGNPIQALGFATAGTATYLQAWMQGLVAYSRASTAVGPELDSWLADFNFTRPPGNPAGGYISVPTPTGANATSVIPIPSGSIFQTDPIVVSPSTVPTVYYFKTTSSAVIPIGSPSVLVPYVAVQGVTGVVATEAAIFNSIPATTSLQFSTGFVVGTGNPVFALGPGISSGNAAPSGGTTVANDPQARAAFVDYIDSLAGSIETALIAGIEESDSYLQFGSTFVLWDYATQPSGVQLAWPGQAVCVFVSPNPSLSGQYTGPVGTDPTADGILQAMNGTLQDPIDAVAFTVVPLVYYANSYEITTLAISAMWVSQSALQASGLSYVELQQAVQGALQALIGQPNAPGLGIAQGIAWSTLIETIRNFSVTQASGAVVSGIITDLTVSGLTGVVQKYVGGSPSGSPIDYASASDGGMVPSSSHQTTIEGTGDPSGVLRWGSSLNITGAGWTTPTYVP